VVDTESRRALADVNQPALVAVHERPQQHAADDGEDGGVRADAERERRDDGEGEALVARERSQREFQIGEEIHGWLDAILLASVPARICPLSGLPDSAMDAVFDAV